MPLSDSASNARTAATNRLHQRMDLQQLRPMLDEMARQGDLHGAIQRLQDWIIANPLDEGAFIILGELYEQTGQTNATVVALQRALELKELSASYQPSASLLQFQKIESGAADDPTNPLFPGFVIQSNREGETRNAFLQLHAERKTADE